jgi:hypothetical protein
MQTSKKSNSAFLELAYAF